jgi:hypothetical protein
VPCAARNTEDVTRLKSASLIALNHALVADLCCD